MRNTTVLYGIPSGKEFFMAMKELQTYAVIKEAERVSSHAQLRNQYRPDGSHDVLPQRQPRRFVESGAYNLENEDIYSDAEVHEHIVSYLAEYRLRVQKYPYELIFSSKPNEGFKIRDRFREEAMSAKANRSITDRNAKGKSIEREVAELAGIGNLDSQLATAQHNDTIFWFSPPGRKKDGYGDYEFLYAGQVDKTNSEDARIYMTAIRIENPLIDQSNSALSALTNKYIKYTRAEDFLANPHVVRGGNLENVDEILYRNFSFEVNEVDARINKRVIQDMTPMIDEFIAGRKIGSTEDKKQAFHALENYALELKERYTREETSTKENIIYENQYPSYRYLVDILSEYGHRPPIATGSCGSTYNDEASSSNIFASGYRDMVGAIFGGLNNKEESYSFDNWGKCIGETCGGQYAMRGPCKLCRTCDSAIRAQNSLKLAA